MKTLGLVLIFYILFIFSMNGQIGMSIGSDQILCKDDEETYIMEFENICTNSTFYDYKWTVQGGQFVGDPQGKTSATVRWTSTATKKVTAEVKYTTDQSGISCPDIEGGLGYIIFTDEASVTFKQAPAVTLSSSFTDGDILCADESITLTSNHGSSFYKDWQYSTNPTVGYQTMTSSTNASVTFRISNYIPSSAYGSPVYFRVRLRPCANSNIGATISNSMDLTVTPPPPNITSINPSNASSECELDGSISFVLPSFSGEVVLSILNEDGTRAFNPIITGNNDGPVTETFVGLAEGVYRIKSERNVPDSLNSCAKESTPVTVGYNAFGFGTVTKTNITCNGAVDGEIEVQVVNGNPPFNYYLKKANGTYDLISGVNDSRNFTFESLGAGSYDVKVEQACKEDNNALLYIEKTDIAEIVEPSAVTFTTSKTNILCKLASTGRITISASGGSSGSYQYSINNGAFTSSPVFSGLAAGDYKIKVKKGSCPPDSTTVTITEPDTNVSIADISKSDYNGYNIACANAIVGTGTITVTASGGVGPYQYSKNNGSSYQSSATLSSLTAGSYQIRIRDGNGCTASENITLDAPPELNVSAVVTKELTCFGGEDAEITVTGSGGVEPLQFSIDNGVEYVSINEFGSLSAGSYVVKVRDLNGCEKFTDLPIVIDTIPEIKINDSKTMISCFGEPDGSIDITIENGIAPLTYQWINNGNVIGSSKDISGLLAGTYELVVTDDNNCSKSKEIVLTEPSALQSDAILSNYSDFNISCFGFNDGSIQVEATGGTTPYSYLWSTGETTPTITDLIAGDYSVVITDFNDCEITENYTLTEPDVIQMQSPQITNVDCFGNATAQVVLNSSGGAGTNTYSLDGINYQSSNTFNGLLAGDYTFQVKDANNCTDDIDVSITEPELLVPIITNAFPATCEEPVGFAKVVVRGGVKPYSISWENSSGEVVGTGDELSGIFGGIYTAFVTDANNCIKSGSINITSTDGAKLTVESVGATSCFNTTDGRASISLNGYAPYEIEWASGEIGPTAQKLVAGLNTVIITDVYGCVVVEQVNIPSPEPIVISTLEKVIPTCNGGTDGSILVDISGGTGNYDIAWSNGNLTNALEGIESGNYSITVTDENACSITENIRLEEKEAIDLEIVELNIPSCVGSSDGSLTVNAIGGNGDYEYIWDNGEDDNTLSNLSAGSYSVIVKDALGCSYQEVIEISDPEPFEILVDNVWEICTGSSYITDYNIPEAVNYNWSSDAGFESDQRMVELSEAGIYKLTVENEKGCVATKDFELIVSDDLLSADMIMASEAYVGDTVMVIDISWPIPDSVFWQIPATATILEQDMEYTSVVFSEPGIHDLSIEVAQAECRDYYSQSINILPTSAEEDANQRIFDRPEKLIKNLSIFPNPALIDFEMNIELTQQHQVAVKIIDLRGNAIIFNESYKGADTYSIPMQNVLNSGVYVIVLSAGKESTYKRIVIK